MEKDSSKIVEGNKKYKNIEQIWSFTLDEGVWKVSNIEEYASLDDYLKQAAYLPKIENTLNQTQQCDRFLLLTICLNQVPLKNP